MRYAKLKKNDIANGSGVCVSLWMQGCPHHCPGCFNPETWDFSGGYPITEDLENEILSALVENGIQRNFSVLGGEPLCPQNREYVDKIIQIVRSQYPNIKIYVWTGYLYENLLSQNDIHINNIFNNINYLIDGPFIQEQKDLNLELRGSANQRIIHLK